MKLVRKLLRILPILVYIIMLLCLCCYAKNETYGYNISDLFNWFDIEGGYYESIMDSFAFISNDTFNNFRNWFTSNISGSYYLFYAFNILVYELFLSLLFLFFDVFNFIIGIGRNWLNKGESLND